MRYIRHRVNTLSELRSVPVHHGVEIDLRDFGDRLILRHDPFGDGEDLTPFLSECKLRGTVILNVKSERIELRILELLSQHRINDFFFLDCSFPMIKLLSSRGERRIAVRFSEFEPIEGALAVAGMVDWVWVDCFTRMPLDADSYRELRRHFKLCAVSPELQGRPQDSISEYAEQLRPFMPDAICTKDPAAWSALGGEYRDDGRAIKEAERG
jgi:hypothetical protein